MVDDDLVMKEVSLTDINDFLNKAGEISLDVEIEDCEVVNIEFYGLTTTPKLEEGVKNFEIYDKN